MPTDLSGTPTSLGIGTYNTSNDAPSGLGFNAAMAQIDALIAARVAKPSGIVLGEVPVWNGTAFVRSSVTNIGSSSLGTGGDGSGTHFLADDQTFKSPGGTTYRKVTAKAVNTTTAATDLLNGEITVAANAMGTNKMLRLTVAGDWTNSSGAGAVFPRFQLLLGATTLIDTNTPATTAVSAGTRFPWQLVFEIINLNAANAQITIVRGQSVYGGLSAGAASAAFTTGSGNYAQAGNSNALIDGANTATAVDTTAAQALKLNVINGSASASYETKLIAAVVEII